MHLHRAQCHLYEGGDPLNVKSLCCTAECAVCTKYTLLWSHPMCTFSVLHACKLELKLQPRVRSHSQVFRHVTLAGRSESTFPLPFARHPQDLLTLGWEIQISLHVFPLDLSTC